MKIIVLSSHTQSLFWFRMEMMQAFIEQGYSVVAIGSEPENEWRYKFEEKGIKYKSISVQRNGINPLKDILTLKAINTIFKEEKPDKVFAYQAKSIVYGSVAARKNQIKEFYSLIAGLGSIFRGKGLKNRIVRLVMQKQYRMACKYSKRVIFQNNDDRNIFLNKKIVEKSKTIIVNGSGVNLDIFKPVSQPKTPTFLFIGRLIKDKGIIEYLEASKIIKEKYKNVRCLLVGPFDSNPSALQKYELTPYIEMNTVEYFGEQSDVRPFLSQCTTFILPSYHEGTPKTVLEAMAMARSIITTDAPGCRETVIPNKNGYLIPIANIEELVIAMEKFILNPEQSKFMGEESFKIVQEKYDVKLVNNTIMKAMNLL